MTEETLSPSQKYMVMIIGVDKYLQRSSKQELKKILALIPFCGNESGGATLYQNLLLSVLNGTEVTFIDIILEAMGKEPYSYNEILKKNFYRLQEFYTDRNKLLIIINQQMLELAYMEEGSGYEEVVKEVTDYLVEKEVLTKIIVFKEDTKVIKEPVITLFQPFGVYSNFPIDYRKMRFVL